MQFCGVMLDLEMCMMDCKRQAFGELEHLIETILPPPFGCMRTEEGREFTDMYRFRFRSNYKICASERIHRSRKVMTIIL